LAYVGLIIINGFGTFENTQAHQRLFLFFYGRTRTAQVCVRAQKNRDNKEAEHTLRLFFLRRPEMYHSTQPVPKPGDHHQASGARNLGLHDRLGLIGLIDEGMRSGAEDSPVAADLFRDLWGLVDRTVSGAHIDSLKPEENKNGFRVLEINSARGENLGRLNMLYLKKPMPCYYLVYVEVAPPFRNKGLGRLVLEHFRDFLEGKGAVGILDNIIPTEDPTFEIYTKQAWEPLDVILGERMPEDTGNIMVYTPSRYKDRDLTEQLQRLIYHLSRKRAAIDMRDNEEMVKRTIAEFRDLYAALLSYFEKELEDGVKTPLMRFMFTRFTTKLIGFRRRIGRLIGYTGGDSLEQLVFHPAILLLKTKSYAPPRLATGTEIVFGESALVSALSEELKGSPARTIEALPNYSRPSLNTWLSARGASPQDEFTIGDFLDMGFDPTRLKEITLAGESYIFERIQARQLEVVIELKRLLERLGKECQGERIGHSRLLTNPPLLAVKDRGNGYVLRRKIPGVHWEEAVEQLQVMPHLLQMNKMLKTDRLIKGTVAKSLDHAAHRLSTPERRILNQLACFIPWDIEANRPRMVVEFNTTYFETVWLA